MGKNKPLFLDKHHNLGSCQLQETLGTFSHLSSFCSPWRMSFLSGYVPCLLSFFQTLSVHLFFETFELWEFGKHSQKDPKAISAICPVRSCPELVLSFKGKGTEGGKRKCKEEKFRWINIPNNAKAETPVLCPPHAKS